MSSVRTRPRLTPEEYLAIERRAETKSEYLDGEMFPMTGGSRWHGLVITNLLRELSQKLKGIDCEVYPGDVRVHIPATGLYTYPDATVVADVPRFLDGVSDTLLNPTLIVEVLSPTTEAYDRGKKFQHYKAIGSLAEYVLVSQETPRIEKHTRQNDGRWSMEIISGLGQKVVLSSIGCELSLAEIYDKVPLG